MITPSEAVLAIDKMIESIPDNKLNHTTLYISIQTAQALIEYCRPLYYPLPLVAEHGSEFEWKGHRCIVL